MSFLSDSLAFELFNGKDMLDKLKKDPKRLLLGVDPASTAAWNKVLGKHDEPIVDQLGGAYGGKVISMGDPNGGVYARAKDAGINTKPASQLQDLAHVISAAYGAVGLGGIGGGAAPTGAVPASDAAPSSGMLNSSGLGIFENGGQGGMAGVGGGNAGELAASHGIAGGAGMGSATETAAPNFLQAMMKQGGFGSMPGMSTGVPPQQQSAPPPQRPAVAPQAPPVVHGPDVQAQTLPDSQVAASIQQGLGQIGAPPAPTTLGQKIMTGLGNARDALTPVDPRVAASTNPAYIAQLRNQAMLKMGLGMMASANQGGRFGTALNAGLGQAQNGFNKDVEGTYERGVQAREETRQADRQNMLDQRYTTEEADKDKQQSFANDLATKNFEETKRYHDATLASLEKRASMKVPGTTMTDDAIDLAAGRILNGEKARDVLANFGRGNQGAANITAVQNRVAAMARERGVSSTDFAVINQELSAQARARTELGAREGKIAPRVQEAENFAQIAIAASKKVPRGKFLPWSKLSQMADTQLNDPDLSAFKAATVSLINAYAGAVGGGQMHVHDQQVAENMLSTAQSPEAYEAVVNQLLRETDAALAAPEQVMDRMRENDSHTKGSVVDWSQLH